ncbi:erythromycin esterase family protein [Aureivirga sp. CE67]|uniref:erythromycin esterase family protein n=1 Tax=Aureivirga sp. CE67 TaxID=1788983 RepID=UPI0018CB5F30|nr:erythromycin esterase family protein [Aureivirga sp. CE67]
MRVILFAIFYCISFTINSQSLKDNIIKNTSEVRTISPNDKEFSDLESLGNAIGESRIVMLGEQDHGDASAFEAKTRIIKYLHEKKGFDVLAFESDFYTINKLSREGFGIDSIRSNIYSVWSNCLEMDPLFEYLKNSKIEITGFDSRITTVNHRNKISFIKEISNSISERIDTLRIPNYSSFKRNLKNIILDEYEVKIDKKNQKDFINTLDYIFNELQKTEPKNSFLLQSLQNLKEHALNAWLFDAKNRWHLPEREAQMADNFIWLVKNKYPNKKIIVWAHNAHIVRDTYKKNNKRIYPKSFGEMIYNSFPKNEVYSIGFNSYKGYTKRSLYREIPGYKIVKPSRNSFENWIFNLGYKNAFINFRSIENTNQFFKMKGVMHSSDKFNWLNCYDGIFYIEEIFPSTKIRENNL